MKRFSKAAMLEHLRTRFERLEKQHGFDRNNGYTQVQNSPTDRQVKYGQWREVQGLIETIENGEL